MANEAATQVREEVEEIKVTTVWKDFLSVIKIGIVNSNLITAFTGLWLAFYFTGEGFLENLQTVFFTLFGSALVIAGACSLNNFIDRDIDHLMERTKTRPTVKGTMEPKRVLWLGVLLTSVGTLSLLMTTLAAAVIGLIGVATYVFLYTMWSKRNNTLNTVIGSFSGAVPPLIGWTAVDPHFHVVPFVLFLLMFLWQPPHFFSFSDEALRGISRSRHSHATCCSWLCDDQAPNCDLGCLLAAASILFVFIRNSISYHCYIAKCRMASVRTLWI